MGRRLALPYSDEGGEPPAPLHACVGLEDSDQAALSAVAQLPGQRGGLPPRALRRVREFVAANLETTVTIMDMADVAGFSPFHFARAFKQSEGVTPHDYVVRCRVRRAIELLEKSDKSLAEIALVCGFSDQSHCARRFREQVGMTPGMFRWNLV